MVLMWCYEKDLIKGDTRLLIITASPLNRPRVSDLLNKDILKRIHKWLKELDEQV